MSDDLAFHNAMLEREREAVEALNRCLAAGAKEDDIKTLARECGVDIRFLTIPSERKEV